MNDYWAQQRYDDAAFDQQQKKRPVVLNNHGIVGGIYYTPSERVIPRFSHQDAINAAAIIANERYHEMPLCLNAVRSYRGTPARTERRLTMPQLNDLTSQIISDSLNYR